MVIEIDGDSHYTEDATIYDQARTEKLASYGLQIIRFTNQEVLHNFEGVCAVVEELIPPVPLKK